MPALGEEPDYSEVMKVAEFSIKNRYVSVGVKE